MGGGGGSSVSVPGQAGNPYNDELAAMARGLWTQTAPIRTSFTDDYFMPFLQGNYKPETMPGFAPAYDLLRGTTEAQYNQGKENILATSPRGGAMASALAKLEMDRARQTGLGTSQLSSSLIGDLWNKAYNTGWVTAPSQSLSGMSSAANTLQSSNNAYLQAQMQAAMAEANQEAMGNQGKTSGLGMMGLGVGSLLGQALTAPTSSILGSGLSGFSSGKGASSGITSGLGGYSSLMSQAMAGGLR